MTYFLVKATVLETPYMNETKRYEDIRLVKAETQDEAEQKYENYWTSKDDPYATGYSVYSINVLNTIE